MEAPIYGLLTGLTMYQTLGAADFCSFELDSASELVASVPRLWLLLPSSPLDSVVAVIATFREVVSGWTSSGVIEIGWTICLLSQILGKVLQTSALRSGRLIYV